MISKNEDLSLDNSPRVLAEEPKDCFTYLIC